MWRDPCHNWNPARRRCWGANDNKGTCSWNYSICSLHRLFPQKNRGVSKTGSNMKHQKSGFSHWMITAGNLGLLFGTSLTGMFGWLIKIQSAAVSMCAIFWHRAVGSWEGLLSAAECGINFLKVVFPKHSVLPSVVPKVTCHGLSSNRICLAISSKASPGSSLLVSKPTLALIIVSAFWCPSRHI